MNLILTFDYELFLGDNYTSYDIILFRKTEQICEMLKKYEIKCTFFADVYSAIQHKKYGLFDYSEAFEKQIQWLVKEGHDVQLHIHPHWIMSKYVDGKWIHKKEFYRLSSFENGITDDFGELHTIDSIISNGKNT